MNIETILVMIILLECAFTIYSVSKLFGEIEGPRKRANRDDVGDYYGGYHYEHGVNTTIAAIITLLVIVEWAVILWVIMRLEFIIPSFYTEIIAIIILAIVHYVLLNKAYTIAEDNEIKVKQLNRQIGYED